jgi:oxygen-dependent protoporphyrinogen oxidase
MHGPATSDPAPRASRPATVAVIGGGIAGLSAAWELTCAAPGTRVVVLEADDRLGGKLRTGEIGGRAVDLGPDAFLARRPEAVALCRELGLGDELVSPGARGAFVWARGQLRALPAGLALGVPTRLSPLARSGILSPAGVGRAAVDLLGWSPRRRAPAHDGTDLPVADITRRRLGRQVTERLVDPLIGGIHAGDTTQMSTAAVFPALLEAAARPGSLMRALRPAASAATPAAVGTPGVSGAPEGEPPVFYTVRGGLARLVDALASSLRARGVEVRLRTPVEHLAQRDARGVPGDGEEIGGRWAVRTAADTVECDGVVIATPAGSAAALLDPVDHAVAAMLEKIAYSDVTLVTMRFRAASVERALEGTGFLVPAATRCLITACTWLTSKWPELQRPGDVLLRASAGRFGDDRASAMSDDEIVERVLEELGPMLGLRAGPTESIVTRWTGAFPQYAVGHVERVRSIEESVAHLPALALAGAALHGVGIPACIASGRQAAHTVLGASVLTGHATR